MSKVLKFDECLVVNREFDNMDIVLYYMLCDLCLFWVLNLSLYFDM